MDRFIFTGLLAMISSNLLPKMKERFLTNLMSFEHFLRNLSKVSDKLS